MMREKVLCLALLGASAFAQSTPPPITADDVTSANAAAVAAVIDSVSKSNVYLAQQFTSLQTQANALGVMLNAAQAQIATLQQQVAAIQQQLAPAPTPLPVTPAPTAVSNLSATCTTVCTFTWATNNATRQNLDWETTYTGTLQPNQPGWPGWPNSTGWGAEFTTAHTTASVGLCPLGAGKCWAWIMNFDQAGLQLNNYLQY